MRRFLLPFLLLPASAMAAAGGHVIVQKGRAFRPAEIAIGRNEPLTFTNEDSFIHQIYVVGLFDSEEKGPGENLNETFPQAGTFQVRCHIHPTMRMTVHVR
jgi:plastocyanin